MGKKLDKRAKQAEQAEKRLDDEAKQPADDDDKVTGPCNKIFTTAVKPALEKAGANQANAPDFCESFEAEVRKKAKDMDEKLKRELDKTAALCESELANDIKNAKRDVFVKNMCAKLMDEPGDKPDPKAGSEITTTDAPNPG